MLIKYHVHLTNTKWENKTYHQIITVIGGFFIPVIQGFHGLHFCLVFLVLPVERKQIDDFFAIASVTGKDMALTDQDELK